MRRASKIIGVVFKSSFERVDIQLYVINYKNVNAIR